MLTQALNRYKILSDSAPINLNQPSLGIPGQTKVSGDRPRETTNEICCLAAECTVTFKQKLVTRVGTRDFTVCMYVCMSNQMLIKIKLYN